MSHAFHGRLPHPYKDTEKVIVFVHTEESLCNIWLVYKSAEHTRAVLKLKDLKVFDKTLEIHRWPNKY